MSTMKFTKLRRMELGFVIFKIPIYMYYIRTELTCVNLLLFAIIHFELFCNFSLFLFITFSFQEENEDDLSSRTEAGLSEFRQPTEDYSYHDMKRTKQNETPEALNAKRLVRDSQFK